MNAIYLILSNILTYVESVQSSLCLWKFGIAIQFILSLMYQVIYVQKYSIQYINTIKVIWFPISMYKNSFIKILSCLMCIAH